MMLGIEWALDCEPGYFVGFLIVIRVDTWGRFCTANNLVRRWWRVVGGVDCCWRELMTRLELPSTERQAVRDTRQGGRAPCGRARGMLPDSTQPETQDDGDGQSSPTRD